MKDVLALPRGDMLTGAYGEAVPALNVPSALSLQQPVE